MIGTKPVWACAISLALYLVPGLARGVQSAPPADRAAAGRIVRYENEHSDAHVEPARMDGQPGLAVVFAGTKDLHYYAREETVPSPGLQLKVEASSSGVEFGKPVFPQWQTFVDSAGKTVEVYAGDFRVFVPIRKPAAATPTNAQITARIRGIACTSQLCLPPFDRTLTVTVDLGTMSTWPQLSPPTITPPAIAQPTIPAHGTALYYLLAVLAGLSINLMPCVLPVLPLILLRLIDQSKRAGGRRLASGLAFSAGVVGFFAVFALVSAIINLTTGAVLDLNSLFRYPGAVIVLFLAIVFFGLVMLDVVTLSLPSAITSRQGVTSGIAGSAGMGFFAGVLSTPCSGALLGFVLVWAQTQPLLVSSTAIVLMGVGMALPYAVLVLVPSLIDRIPKPGHWMEVFKKSTAFLLFFIAVKLTLAALPKDRLLNVLTYGIVFSFCAWMWGKWVDFSTPASRRWTIRTTAVLIAAGGGLWLLPMPGRSAETAIDWQPYDAKLVQQAVSQNRPVLLDFMADWCTNCKIVDRKVYHDPDVARLIRAKGVLAIKADTTVIDYPATKDLQQVYGEAGNVPVNVVLLPDGSQEKLRGIFDKGQLVQILNRLPEATAHGGEEKLDHNPKSG
ncbi:MAG: thioredoxin family protein [Phycisphaerae bacterium]|nr:thioredoxin family protein [Phycisphaerae bacterium]